MRILVISDVHGNRSALDAVLREPHDFVVCLGDTVGYGPDPAYCVRELRRRGAAAVQGNHDRAAAYGVSPGAGPGFEGLAEVTFSVTRAQLETADIRYLRLLPTFQSFEVDGTRFVAVHATRTDPFYGRLGPEDVRWEAELERTEADVLLVGNTHRQFERRIGRRRLIGPGSVGQPRDGDPRAAYALVDVDGVKLRRVPYRVETTVARLEAAGLPSAALSLLATVLRTGGLAPVDPLAKSAGRSMRPRARKPSSPGSRRSAPPPA